MRKLNLQHILCALFLLAAASGCMRPDAIAFHGVSDVDFVLSGSPAVTLVADVENSSAHNLTVRDAMFSLCRPNGDRIGRVMLTEAVTLPRKSRTDLTVPMRVTLDNMLSGVALLANPGEIDGLYVSGEATVKAGCLKRRISIDRMPLSAFLKRVGVDPDTLKEMLP